MTYVKRTGLNHWGVKNSADMWRTIGGVVWPHFAIVEDADPAPALRQAGLRARRFGEEVFVHPDDIARAVAVYDAWRSLPAPPLPLQEEEKGS